MLPDGVTFGDNCNDQSDDSGFQFEFTCEGCGESWRTPYKRYAAGAAGDLLNAAGSLLGGVLSGAGEAADRVRQAGYRAARDQALKEAVREAETHFHLCPACHNHFCAKCWSTSSAACTSCVESGAAKKAPKPKKTAKPAPAEAKPKAFCPACGEKTPPEAKFCPACGGKL